MECLCCLARKAVLLAQAIERGIPAQRSTNRKRSSGSAAGCSQKKRTRRYTDRCITCMNQVRIRQVHSRLQKICCFICASLVSCRRIPCIKLRSQRCPACKQEPLWNQNQIHSSDLCYPLIAATLCHYGVSPTDAASTSLDGHVPRTRRAQHLFSWLLSSAIKLVNTMTSGSDWPSNTPTELLLTIAIPCIPQQSLSVQQMTCYS